MRKPDHDAREEEPNARIIAAGAGLRRQLRIQAILLTIVGIEVTVFIVLRTWNAFS